MVVESVTEKRRDRFSSVAQSYDDLSVIHREIGHRLLEKIPDGARLKMILDVGMGTGYLTEQAARRFSGAQVIGIDAAFGMARFAALHRRDIHSLCADAEMLPIKKESVDIIVSNLALQWATDLDAVFRSCYDVLCGDGRMVATIFGRETFRELFAAIEKTALRPGLTFKRLADFETIRIETEKYFCLQSALTCEELRIEFSSMKDLLRWAKGLGANALGQGVFIGKDHLRRAEEYYQQHFASTKGVFATLEVIWLEAQR